MDAHRRHCADSAAADREAEFDDWCEQVDSMLYSHRISPAALTRAERLAAFNDGIDAETCADSFAHSHYVGCVAPGDCDEPVDYAYADQGDNYVDCPDCGGRRLRDRSCDCFDNHCQ